jgi:hypothetical protein
MVKALMLSVVLATVAIPALAAREPRPWRAVGLMLAAWGVFAVLYLWVVMFVTPAVSLQ